jgi:hypothetical protein
MSTYEQFLASKVSIAEHRGLSSIPALSGHLFSFQKLCVEFGLSVGSFGLFLDTGLGKTACELEWATHAAEASNGKALILTPLAVARQIEAEGKRWGYRCRVIRSAFDVKEGINVCNYDRIELLDTSDFGAIVLDESSILKDFSGKTTRALIETFRTHRWRMCASATPSPNDHTEIGNHSEFLGVLARTEMLIRWFVHDSNRTSEWRLKGHAREAFWEWMISWARMAEHPQYLGDDVAGYDLPELKIVRHEAEGLNLKTDGTTLFRINDLSATGIHELKRETTEVRARSAASALSGTKKPAVVWCDTDYEADALWRALKPEFDGKLIEVRGSHSIDFKEESLQRFADGTAQILITKSSICGFGLNWQHCDQMVFVGRSFSYESWYQAVRRCWRFGQKNPVTVHLIVADGEDSIGRVIDRKANDHDSMKREMSLAMLRAIGKESKRQRAYLPSCEAELPSWFVA